MALDLTGPIRTVDVDEVIPPAAPPVVKRLRDSHHAVARLMAAGLRPAEVSAQTGYALSRLSILQNDPAFMELLAFYRADSDRVAKDVEALFRMVGLDFLQELHERLQDSPGDMADGFLLEAVKALLDRAGHSPVNRSLSKSMVLNIGERYERATKDREKAA